MIRFYKLRAENPLMPKGEAFRQAQLSLLNGTTGSGKPGTDDRRSDPISLDDTGVKLQLFTKDPAKPFAHPHYWASFVLIGNWR
jgi:CHAT domain-containing protein